MLLRRHIPNVFSKESHPLENKNLNAIFDYCENLIKPIDFHVNWLIDGGYYGQGVSPERFSYDLKDGVRIAFILDYDGLGIKLLVTDEYYNLKKITAYPSRCKTDMEWYLTNQDFYTQKEAFIYLLSNWNRIKEDLSKCAETLKKKSLDYEKKKEQEDLEESEKEVAWQKQMKEFKI